MQQVDAQAHGGNHDPAIAPTTAPSIARLHSAGVYSGCAVGRSFPSEGERWEGAPVRMTGAFGLRFERAARLDGAAVSVTRHFFSNRGTPVPQGCVSRAMSQTSLLRMLRLRRLAIQTGNPFCFPPRAGRCPGDAAQSAARSADPACAVKD